MGNENLSRPSWLYWDKQTADAYARIHDQVEGKGTVDELGFAPLYDYIAEELFPWCSTLTTRARYFHFFTATLQISLAQAIKRPRHLETMSEQEVMTFSRARDQNQALLRTLHRNEMFLAFSLGSLLTCRDSDSDQRGVFGIRTVTGAFSNAERPLNYAKKILSLPGRYPNAIYRGSASRLGVFADVNRTTNSDTIAAYLRGESFLSTGWESAIVSLVEELQEVFAFWNHHYSRSMGDATAVKFIKEFPHFSGFAINNEIEKRTLVQSMIRVTPYVEHLLSEAAPIGKTDQTNLQALSQFLKKKNPDASEIFLVGYHIDRVTRPFRELYKKIVDDPQESRIKKEFSFSVKPKEMSISAQWLDEKCNKPRPMSNSSTRGTWLDAWQDSYSVLIQPWIRDAQRHSHVSIDLQRILKQRAEDIVSLRGKIAPHRRRDKVANDEADVSKEIEFNESSFRLWNALRILRDIRGDAT